MARFLVEIQLHGDDGNPGSGFKYHFYETGTTTPKNTYSDEAETTANANPVVADANGRIGDVWFSGAIKLVVKTAAGVTVPNGTFDPIYANKSAAGDGSSWSDWSSTTSYSVDDIVIGSDNQWYQSITNTNENNDPTTTTTYWVQIGPIYIWDAITTYAENDFVYDEALLYRSKVDSNLNNKPWTSKTQFEALGLQYRHQAIGEITGGSTALDLTRYNSFSATLSTAQNTFTFSNEPEATEMYTFDMILENAGALGTGNFPVFPASVVWTRGFVPNWTVAGFDGITFVKYPDAVSTSYYANEFILDAQ